MQKNKKKKVAAKKTIIKKKKPVAKKKIIAKRKRPVSKKNKNVGKKKRKVSGKIKAFVDISKEKFDYFMAKIAAI
ncbi:MAG: hypothetical protein AAB529_00395 [Patescibacteria group bacterium]